MKLREYRKRIEAVMLAKIPRKDGETLTPWQHIASRSENGAFEFVYRVPVGYAFIDIQRQSDALFAACGAAIEIKDFAGAVLLRVFVTDFPQVIHYEKEMLCAAQGKKDIIVGYDRQGRPLLHSLRVPFLLIAGKSGYGKTDFIRWLLLQLLMKNSPQEVEFWIIDLKGFSFLPFKNIPHISRIVRDLPGALSVLASAVSIMEKRAAEVWQSENRGLTTEYKTIFVLIDEAYMISPSLTKDKERKKLAAACDEFAAKISSTGREAGIGLFYCTQRPDSEVINPLVKANMDSKICFKTETESNSLIVLDRPGAEKLPHGKPGRLLYSRDGLQEAQAPYIGNDEAWEEVLKPLKGSGIDESEGIHFDTGAGYSNHKHRSGGPLLLPEWQPIKEGQRSAEKPGKGKAD